ncbi:hypothetical protein [Staphylococcus simulans]|uniref:hypothetical protein n=1 Tax=Staphylococcus simulans TaxID=1286 RepID=UPI000D0327BA|nr:hypothetical protein [Staphylococcus simulans]
MLSLKLKELTSDGVTYLYYPKNDETIELGLIKMKIGSLEILQAEKSGIERNGNDNYFIHAISKIRSNTKDQNFPESDFVAWG